MTFNVGDIYLDSSGLYWVVMGTTGSVTSSYTSWGTFVFIRNYPDPATALIQCGRLAVTQDSLCPGVPPPTTVRELLLCFDPESCGNACNCNSILI